MARSRCAVAGRERLPSGYDDGPRPALLHRTPYDRTDPTLVSAIVADPLWLARQGFAVVVQDVRGKFASEGEYHVYQGDRTDWPDTFDWIGTQPWSTGNVGMVVHSGGASFLLATISKSRSR